MIEIISKSILFLYRENELIYYQNSYPLNLFLILQGEVCFKKYTNNDLLAMIGGEENIIVSKRYSKEKNSKMNKKNMLFLRNTAFVKGKDDINNKNSLKCGEFFGDDNLMNNTTYDNCAIASKDTIILEINNEIFNFCLREKIAKTKENIRALILHRFTLFKQVEVKQFKQYMEKIDKIYPKNGEIICKENDISNKLYLIFQGRCAVQKLSRNLGSIIFLNKGDLFGYDSLLKFPHEYQLNQKINIVKCEYTIVCKDDSTIVLRFDIPFIDGLITWRLNNCLLNYFLDQRKIIQKYEKFKNISTKILQDKYKNLDIRKRKSNNNKFSYECNNSINLIALNKAYKNWFNKAISSEKDNLNRRISNKRRVNLISQHFKKLSKNNKFLFYGLEKHYSLEKKNSNKIKLLSNDIPIQKKDKFSTPVKSKKNYIFTSCIYLKKDIAKKHNKSSSTISTNNKSSSNKIRNFSTYSRMSNLGEDSYKNKLISNKYKILIKKKEIYSTKNNKMILKNSKKETFNTYLINDNKKCTKFECNNKMNGLDECMPFILSKKEKFISSFKNNSNKKKMTHIKDNIYNYPFSLNGQTLLNN